MIEDGLDVFDEFFRVCCRWFRFIAWGHGTGLDLFDDVFPDFAIADQGVGVFESGEVQFGLRVRFGVAFRAVFFDGWFSGVIRCFIPEPSSGTR